MRSVAADNDLTHEARQAFNVQYATREQLAGPRFSEEAAAEVRRAKCAPIVHKNADKQIVYGVVYAPGEVDAHGDIMNAPAIEEMAHKFLAVMAEKGMAVIDQQHDNVAVSAYPVESWIETEEGKPWPVGSWLLGVKIADPVVWKKVKDGDINGFSFEAMVSKMPVVVEVEAMPDLLAKTYEAAGHDHVFFLEFDEQTGRVVNGITSMELGHRHVITMATATEKAAAPGIPSHAHRLPVN